MLDRFSRTRYLLGKEAMEKLNKSKVVIFGIGGVGGYVAEALARSGIGEIHLVDNDSISVSNINRQIIATEKTVGMPKAELMAARIHDICSETKVVCHKIFYDPETVDFPFEDYDYVIDAIDSVKAKIGLIVKCTEKKVPIISSMGTGNKLDPVGFKVADIYKTKVCPLAKVMRYELKKRGVKKLKVVYSEEQPIKPQYEGKEATALRPAPASVSFVPPVAGYIIASEVVKDLIKE